MVQTLEEQHFIDKEPSPGWMCLEGEMHIGAKLQQSPAFHYNKEGFFLRKTILWNLPAPSISADLMPFRAGGTVLGLC